MGMDARLKHSGMTYLIAGAIIPSPQRGRVRERGKLTFPRFSGHRVRLQV